MSSPDLPLLPLKLSGTVSDILLRLRKKPIEQRAPFLSDIEGYFQKRQFVRYLMWFPSESRLCGFLEIEPLLTDAEYWPLLRGVWIMSRSIVQNKRHWLRLLKTKRDHRDLLMCRADRELFESLPSRVTIYRGASQLSAALGLSWSLDLAVAKKIANLRMGRLRPCVVSGTCAKAEVLAIFTEREESEIVIQYSKVRGRDVTSL